MQTDDSRFQSGNKLESANGLILNLESSGAVPVFSLAGSKVEIATSEGLSLRDPTAKALRTITYPHSEIHSGSSYVVFNYDADFDKSSTLNMCFKTPDTSKWKHLVAVLSCTVPSVATILEAPTVTSGSGTPKIIYNKNRNSSNISGALDIEDTPTAGKVSTNCTITDDGTLLLGEALGVGKGTLAIAISRDISEFVLRQNTVYAFRITGTGVLDNGIASIVLTWYEHTDA